MRLLMLGTGPFAVPTFRALYDTRHSVAALVTAPLAPIGASRSSRSVRSATSPGSTAPRSSIPRTSTRRMRRRDWQSFEADLLVVCDYGQILSPATLAAARRGGVNLHASLLPKYRGAAPINWAIYHGETETGVTVIHMTPQIDAGPCIAQTRVAIGPDETAAELEARLAEVGARLVCETIDSLEAGRVRALPQRRGPGQQGPAAEEDRRADRLDAVRPQRSRTTCGRWSLGRRPTPFGIGPRARRFA